MPTDHCLLLQMSKISKNRGRVWRENKHTPASGDSLSKGAEQGCAGYSQVTLRRGLLPEQTITASLTKVCSGD